MSSKLVTTSVPIHELLATRWSPRAFTEREVSPTDVVGLLEAARLAPSCFNEQPWRYIVGIKQDREQYDRVLGCLVEWNRNWAKLAPVVMITLAKLRFAKNDKPNRHAYHDVGLASMSLTVEAMARGLHVHHMGGIDIPRIRETFAVPEGWDPVAGVAIGYIGEVERLDDTYREDELAPRTRKPLREVAIGRVWDEPSAIVT